MKYKFVEQSKKKELTFKELDAGEYFVWPNDNYIFQKVKTQQRDTKTKYNTLDISDGVLYNTSPNERVQRVNQEDVVLFKAVI